MLVMSSYFHEMKVFELCPCDLSVSLKEIPVTVGNKCCAVLFRSFYFCFKIFMLILYILALCIPL